MKRTALCLLLSLAVPAVGQSNCTDTAGFDSIVQDMVNTLGLRGAGLRLEQDGALLHENVWGTHTPDTSVPLASATKWLSTAVLMSCVESGHLRLDDPVSLYVASFQRPDKIAITLRQCFSHTSGLPEQDPIVGDRSVTSAQAADYIATLPMIATPGTALAYGGVSMHVAGRCCEVATGRSWAALFRQRIAQPLGLVATDYYAFGFTTNPRIGGGARSTLREYARVVEMLRADGMYGTTRVLAAASIAEMYRDHTSGLTVLHSPHPHGAPYGIGTWLERLDTQGRPRLVSTAGAFGFTAWVDVERGVGGTLSVVDNFNRVWPFTDRLFVESDRMLKPLGIDCVGVSTPACNGPLFSNGNRLPRAAEASFKVAVHAAPPESAGAFLLGDADPSGTPVLGIRLHLMLTPPPLVLNVWSDTAGTASVQLPLHVAAGTRFATQFVFLNTATCGGAFTLSSSHALDVTVQPQ